MKKRYYINDNAKTRFRPGDDLWEFSIMSRKEAYIRLRELIGRTIEGNVIEETLAGYTECGVSDLIISAPCENVVEIYINRLNSESFSLILEGNVVTEVFDYNIC